jgi:aminomethyltransferase
MTSPRNIPLHAFHAEHGARFVNFGGWNMPVQYTSILEEHKAVRTAAGLFDVSHMGEFLVAGPDAGAYLDRLLTNKITAASEGRAIYSPMCAQGGTVVDDLIVYKIAENDYLVCVNAGNIEKDFDWFSKYGAQWDMKIDLSNVSDEFALLALQGPAAEAILTDCGFETVKPLKRFCHRQETFHSAALRICRTGYTGEDGFEIYVPPEAAERLARLLMEKGERCGLKLCGLGARDSLRLEAGLPLYGHELSNEISPIEAGLGWTVKFDKGEFNGRAALLKQKQNGPEKSVIHFQLAGRRIARQGTPVVDSDGEAIGHVLSGTLSPVSSAPIGSALVPTDRKLSPLFVDLRGHHEALEVKRPPLHK